MAVDYHVDDFVEVCQRITAGKGINVVLDVIGGEYLNRNVSTLATKGTIVQVGLMGGGSTPFNIAALMPKRARLIGTVLRPRPLEEKIVVTQRFINEILPMFDTGKLRPVIDSRYSLENISAAHRYMETNASTGKIVINV